MTGTTSDSGSSPPPAAGKAKRSTKGASAPFVVPEGKVITESKPEKAEAVAGQSTSPQEAEPIAAASRSEPAIIVFGKNESQVPQAAWFSAADAELATRAALLIGLRVLKIEDDAHKAAAGQLRQGQVYASDRTFAPAVNQIAFDKVRALAGPADKALPSEVKAAVTNGEPLPPPTTWDQIAVGHVVLTLENDDPEEDWFEASVVGVDAKGDLVLRWRHSPRDRSFTTRRSRVALMPAQAA